MIEQDPNYRESWTCPGCDRIFRRVLVPVRCPCGTRSGFAEAIPAMCPPSQVVTMSDFMADSVALAHMLPPVRLVVGVARSGMIPAGIIATIHSADIASISETGGLHHLGGGDRWRSYPERGGIVVVVEDSCYSGRSLARVRDIIGDRLGPIKFAAVYTSPKNPFQLDYSVRMMRSHWFEWNFANTVWSHQLAFDLDGTICPDFTAEEDDDGERYLARLRTMPTATIVPRTKPVHIITARLERYREETRAWLDAAGVLVAELHMGPWATKREREKSDVWGWKGTTLASLDGVTHYVESDDTGAKVIADTSGKPVVCNTSGRIYQPGSKARGLGDVIHRLASAVGVRQCGGCRKRQEALNKLAKWQDH